MKALTRPCPQCNNEELIQTEHADYIHTKCLFCGWWELSSLDGEIIYGDSYGKSSFVVRV